MEIITCKEAKERGLKRYFTGKPCKRGHLSERRTCNGVCIKCDEVAGGAWRNTNKERIKNTNTLYYSANKDQILAQKKDYYDANSDRIKDYNKALYRKKLLIRKAKDKAYREANKERIRTRNKRWRDSNPNYYKDQYAAKPQQFKSKVIRRYHAKRAAEGMFSQKDIDALLAEQNNKCLTCGVEFSSVTFYTIDHDIPISRGGSNWPSNLNLLCCSCNSRKGTKTLTEFMCEVVDALVP